jgi:hypothetical protein
MNRTLACALAAAVMMAAGSAIPGAPEQTTRPGEMTRAEVWIQNRGRPEAVPVTIQEVATVQITGTPAVQISGTPTVAISPSSVVPARLVRQAWDYQTVTVMSGQDPVTTLSKAGQDGWEAIGLQFPMQGGIGIVLKRPRP